MLIYCDLLGKSFFFAIVFQPTVLYGMQSQWINHSSYLMGDATHQDIVKVATLQYAIVFGFYIWPFPLLKKKVSHLCSYEQDQSCSEMCIVCDNSRMRWHVQCWNHVKNVKSAADFKSILICISTKSEFNFHSTKVTLWVTRMPEYA